MASYVPIVLCADNKQREKLIRQCPSFTAEQKYSWFTQLWLVQLLLYLLHRKRPRVQFRRQMIMVGEDPIALDWDDQCEAADNAPVVVLLPTLVGGSREMSSLITRLREAGYRCVVMIRRGHDGLTLKSPSWDMMGNIDDVDAAVAHIQAQYANAPLFLVGVSAGSGLAARYLAAKGDNTPFTADVLMSPGYDVQATFEHIHPLIDLAFLAGIKRKVLWRHREVLRQAPRFWYALLCCWSMRSLYRNLWGVAGFNSFEEMDLASNPVHTMHKVKKPTLCINTEDDRGTPWEENTRELFQQTPNGVLLLHAVGGHVGGRPSLLNGHSVFEDAVVEFLNAFR